MKADAIHFLGQAGGPFDLVLADPPYDLPDAMEKTLSGIAEHSVLTDAGTLVYELRSSDAIEVSPEWELMRNKVYGDTRVLMLRLKRKDKS